MGPILFHKLCFPILQFMGVNRHGCKDLAGWDYYYLLVIHKDRWTFEDSTINHSMNIFPKILWNLLTNYSFWVLQHRGVLGSVGILLHKYSCLGFFDLSLWYEKHVNVSLSLSQRIHFTFSLAKQVSCSTLHFLKHVLSSPIYTFFDLCPKYRFQSLSIPLFLNLFHSSLPLLHTLLSHSNFESFFFMHSHCIYQGCLLRNNI